jgi:hypothetical protein
MIVNERFDDILSVIIKWKKSIKQEFFSMMQYASDIKVGDVVIVFRGAISYEMGWGDEWVEQMNDFVGKYCKVVGIDRHLGIRIQSIENGTSWNFPFFVLQKIEDKSKNIFGQNY